MKRLQLILVLMGFGSALMAQQFPYSYIEVNNVRGCILGNGCIYDSHQATPYSSWEVPKDSGKSPLFFFDLHHFGYNFYDYHKFIPDEV